MGKKEEEVKNIEVMDAGKCKDDEVDEQGQWFLDGKNNVGDHYMKSCSIVGDKERRQQRMDFTLMFSQMMMMLLKAMD